MNYTPPTGDLIIALMGIAVIVMLFPLAVSALLDGWGDRHTEARRAAMTAAATLPIIVTILIAL